MEVARNGAGVARMTGVAFRDGAIDAAHCRGGFVDRKDGAAAVIARVAIVVFEPERVPEIVAQRRWFRGEATFKGVDRKLVRLAELSEADKALALLRGAAQTCVEGDFRQTVACLNIALAFAYARLAFALSTFSITKQRGLIPATILA